MENSNFFSKYPFWYCFNLSLKDSVFNNSSIFPICHFTNTEIYNCRILSEQACSNCANLIVKDSYINSIEFAWKSDRIIFENNYIFGDKILLNC